MVLFHNGAAVELVPQHAIVEVGGILHHVGGVLLPGHDAILLDIPLLRYPIPHHPVEVGNHHIAGASFHAPHQGAGGVGGDPVIAVQELQVCSFRVIQRQIPAGGDTGVGLMEDPNPAVPVRAGITDGAGTVGAAVIHQQQLKILVLLIQNAVDTASNGFFRIVDRDDDADGGTHRPAPFGRRFFYFVHIGFAQLHCALAAQARERPWLPPGGSCRA